MSRTLLASVIVAITILVAFLDFSTSAELIVSILFFFPLGLCALQRSKRLLWGIAAAAVVLTIAAEFWGFHRAELLMDNEHASGNRAFLILGLLTVTALVHFWIEKNLPEAAPVATAMMNPGA